MEDMIPKKNKSKSPELINPIFSLERPENEDLEPSEYVDHTCHNTSGDSTSGKHMIKTLRSDSGTPEEWIIFVDLV